ncbi:MAG TPA: hypothetical protein PKM44_02655 [Turneriella sp.]|nr:hypothetical protein [Turneriella sp.]HNJ64439.1 hypothetical protein [Turneriella sp.]HNL09384.1 hypothetical protein [Turneriella sp.]HNN01839.1 hypothetical protein [Turneriella sp.]
MLSDRFMRTLILLSLAVIPAMLNCRGAVQDMEIRHDIRYLAAFSSNSLVNPEDEKRFNDAFQSRYRSRVVLLRPVTGQAHLSQLNARASLFAVIKINAQREARAVAHEMERALGGQLITLLPLSESAGSQDSFSGQAFYLALEKRTNAFSRLNGSAKAENLRLEADDMARDRNLLSYFAALMLTDTPYQTVHLLGFSGLAETEYETFDGLYHRSMRKLEAADTALVEKIR